MFCLEDADTIGLSIFFVYSKKEVYKKALKSKN